MFRQMAFGITAALGAGAAGMAGMAHAAQPEAAPLTLAQGWDDAMRDKFYFTPQGSRIMPNAWFRALESVAGGAPFSGQANMARFGLIAAPGPSALNPDGYPIGFAVDPGDPAAGIPAQAGMTCAPCHTAIATVNGRQIRVDGAPAHLDFDTFYAELNRAVTATLLDPARFARFAGQVLGAAPTAQAIQTLQGRFALFQVTLAGDAQLRSPMLASGFGRVDALTQIVNALAVRDQRETGNLFPVATPASYPALWLTPDLEYVQWSPIAASPIARNGGQALGVFGAANLAPGTDKPFDSSMLIKQWHDLELWVTDLTPPP